jgi:hypothetical protein
MLRARCNEPSLRSDASAFCQNTTLASSQQFLLIRRCSNYDIDIQVASSIRSQKRTCCDNQHRCSVKTTGGRSILTVLPSISGASTLLSRAKLSREIGIVQYRLESLILNSGCSSISSMRYRSPVDPSNERSPWSCPPSGFCAASTTPRSIY